MRCTNSGIGKILPVNCHHKKSVTFMLNTSIFWTITILILLSRTSLAIKYETAYACEGKTLIIECEHGYLISLIRANYGRFSITICNDHGNTDWSVNCMSQKTLSVLTSKCAQKENCSILASTNLFGDPCPGTHKYLEAHYQCVSATQQLTTTTTRPSPPSLLSQKSSSNNIIWTTISTSTTTTKTTSVAATPITSTNLSTISFNKTSLATSLNGKNFSILSLPDASEIHLAGRSPNLSNDLEITKIGSESAKPLVTSTSATTTSTVPTILVDATSSTIKNNSQTIQSTASNNVDRNNDEMINNSNDGGSGKIIKSQINNDENYQLFCGPTTARNLFWNLTRIGEVNVQPCPGGATGIAKWRCILMAKNKFNDTSQHYQQLQQQQQQQQQFIFDQKIESAAVQNDCNFNLNFSNSNNQNLSYDKNSINDNNCDKISLIQQQQQKINSNLIPTWYPQTPDLTQCRSVWLNNLEISVNQRDSSIISIANDLSQVTSSKVLYGGDMLVTTKMIQTMSEKMTYDIETFPDQRQREAIIKELLLSVVKTGSNLLDESQLLSWLDLSFEDQMRVATSLLTGLEHNAFLLADSTIREKDVLQSVKNILLAVRVIETRNVANYETFPDSKRGEQWPISTDRIELPRSALIENSEGGLVRIVFVAFDRLELILKPSYDNLDLKISNKNILNNNTNLIQQRVRILNSKVISASLGKGRHIQLSQPIKLILRHIKYENVSNPTCVYWNYIDHAWSTDGCYLESTNRTHSICMCNHLTNFAILMDVVDDFNTSLLALFDNKLRVFIYISIGICIVFIVIAILTLKLFNAAFIKSTRTSIYKNIYVCLFIIEMLFLLGVEQNETSLLCGFSTAFLHCFILSTIAWLFFEGFQLYKTLITDDMLLQVENSSKIIWYYLLSYGLSFTIVAISLAIDPSTYTQSDFCVLMESNGLFYATFMIPLAVFTIGAIGYTSLACYIMCKKNKSPIKNKEHTKLSNIRFDLRCSVMFLIILSADWIFAYLYLRTAKTNEELSFRYGYLFVIFNSLLGIYIFIFHCIQNEKIRREYCKYVRQNSWLPKCLRCSKTSIASPQQQVQHHIQQQHQQYVQPNGKPIGNNSTDQFIRDLAAIQCLDGDNDGSTGGIGGGVNTPTIRRNKLMSCNDAFQQHHIKSSSLISTTIPPSSSERQSAVLRTPSCGHTSPTSSIGSTHLIFNQMQQQQQQQQQQQDPQWNYQSECYSSNPFNNLNTYDEQKFLQYDCKSKRLKDHQNVSTMPRNSNSGGVGTNVILPQYQQHEYFYWTEKKLHNKKPTDELMMKYKNDGNINANTFYPSYKKTTTMIKNYQHDDGIDYCADIEPEINRKYHQRYATLNSSDDCGSGKVQLAQQQQLPQYHHQQHNKYNKHSNCDLTKEIGGGTDFNRDEPVYEEILNSRLAEVCNVPVRNGIDDYVDHDDDDGDDDDDNEKDDDVDNYNKMKRMIARSGGSGNGSGGQTCFRHDINTVGIGKFYDQHQQDMTTVMPISSTKQPYQKNSPHQQQQHQQQQPKYSRGIAKSQSHDQTNNRITGNSGSSGQVIGRNLSAMLDENNTVICYLEPLPK